MANDTTHKLTDEQIADLRKSLDDPATFYEGVAPVLVRALLNRYDAELATLDLDAALAEVESALRNEDATEVHFHNFEPRVEVCRYEGTRERWYSGGSLVEAFKATLVGERVRDTAGHLEG